MSLTLYEGMDGMLENTFINVKNQLDDPHGRTRNTDRTVRMGSSWLKAVGSEAGPSI